MKAAARLSLPYSSEALGYGLSAVHRRARLGLSPDAGDALAQTFAEPVQRDRRTTTSA